MNRIAIQFVSAQNDNNPADVANNITDSANSFIDTASNLSTSTATGDIHIFLILAILLLFITGAFLLYKLCSKKSMYSCSSCSKKILAFTRDKQKILCLILCLLLSLSVVLASSVKAHACDICAYTDSAVDNSSVADIDLPDCIKAVVDENKNAVTIEPFAIKNLASKPAFLNSVAVQSSIDDTHIWKLAFDESVVYYDQTNSTTELEKGFNLPSSEQVLANMSTNMNVEYAKNLIGQNCFSLNLYIEDIPNPYALATEPTIEPLTYNGEEQIGVVGNETIDITGTFKAINAGEYTAYVTPKEGYMWSDLTDGTKEISWNIDKCAPQINLSDDKAYLNIAESADINISYVAEKEVAVSVKDSSIASVQYQENKELSSEVASAMGTITITGLMQGDTSVDIALPESQNYKSASTLISVSVGKHFTGHTSFEYMEKEAKIDIKFDFNPLKILNMDNTVYNKDLSYLTVVSSINSYMSYKVDLDEYEPWDVTDSTTFFKILGFDDIEDVRYKGSEYDLDPDDLVNVVMCHKIFDDRGQKKDLVMITFYNTSNDGQIFVANQWYSNFDIGNSSQEYKSYQEHPDWLDEKLHKGFGVASTRLSKVVKDYLSRIKTDAEQSILVTGHSRSAAVTNLISKDLTDSTDAKVFGYAYATPLPIQQDALADYPNIVNVCNQNDLITSIPLENWGFKKYGVSYELDESQEKYSNMWKERFGMEYTPLEKEKIMQMFAGISDSREALYTINDKLEYVETYDTKEKADQALESLIDVMQGYNLVKFQKYEVVQIENYYTIEVSISPSYYVLYLGTLFDLGIVNVEDAIKMISDTAQYFSYTDEFQELISTMILSVDAINCSHVPANYYFLVDTINSEIAQVH